MFEIVDTLENVVAAAREHASGGESLLLDAVLAAIEGRKQDAAKAVAAFAGYKDVVALTDNAVYGIPAVVDGLFATEEENEEGGNVSYEWSVGPRIGGVIPLPFRAVRTEGAGEWTWVIRSEMRDGFGYKFFVAPLSDGDDVPDDAIAKVVVYIGDAPRDAVRDEVERVVRRLIPQAVALSGGCDATFYARIGRAG